MSFASTCTCSTHSGVQICTLDKQNWTNMQKLILLNTKMSPRVVFCPLGKMEICLQWRNAHQHKSLLKILIKSTKNA